MSRVPSHPPGHDPLAKVIGGKSAVLTFKGTESEARAVLDEVDAKVKAIAPSSVGPKDSAGQ